MLVTFKSKAAADVLMYEEHAKRILDLLHKDVKRGIITAGEIPQAIARVEQEIDDIRRRQEEERARRAEAGEPEEEHEVSEGVGFATRAFPLLEMLRMAEKKGKDVMWGV